MNWVVFAETQGIKSDFYADNIVRFGAAALITADWQVDASFLYSLKDTPSFEGVSTFTFSFVVALVAEHPKDENIKRRVNNVNIFFKSNIIGFLIH